MRRKFLSVLLAASMVLTLVPTAAWAAEENKLTFALSDSSAELTAGDEDKTAELTISGTVTAGETLADTDPVTFSLKSSESQEQAGKISAEDGAIKIEDTTLSGTATLDYSGLEAGTYTAMVTVNTTVSGTTEEGGETPAAEGDTTKVYTGTAEIEIKAADTGNPDEEVAAPTFTPAAGEVEKDTTITLTSTTDGAKIYFTMDGKDPTAESQEYNDQNKPTISEAATVKAIAVKEGMTNSDVATAEYTIKEASVDPDPTPDEVGEVTVALTAPAKGAVPAATIEAVEGHGAGTIEWTGDLTEAGKFKGGVAYTATVTLAPAEGKAWADTVTVTVTGQTAKEPTVKDGNLTFTVEYAALDAAVLSSIAVTTLPTKVTYEVGDDFDPAGMVVTGTFDDGTTKELTTGEYTLSGNENLAAGEQTVTITSKSPLAEKTATVKVTVTKKTAELAVGEAPTFSGTVTYGDSSLGGTPSGGKVTIKDAEQETVVTGTWAWKEGQKPTAAGEQKFIAVFTPEASDTYEYAPLETEITVTVAQATPTFTVENQSVSTKNGATLDRVVVPEKADGVNGAKVSGTFKWIKSENDTDELDANPFENKTSGEKVTIWWTFTPDASETNYVGDVLKG